jgi:hypothetical protein
MLDTYNANSTLQATCQQVGNPMLERMADAYAAGKTGHELKFVRLADFGCSGGRNSFEPMRSILSPLSRRAPGLRAECVLEDLPSNPWHQVMEEASRLTGYFDGRVQVLCAGTSFYEQVCADESLDMAYSYVASHFLSDSKRMTSHVMMHEAGPEERRAWEAQAASDWERFLLLRARELKPGGKIMISTMCRDDSGYSWKQFSHLVWDSIQKAHARKSLTRREAEALCIPACLRSEAEIMAPFVSGSPAGAAFEVDSLQFQHTEVEGEKDLPTAQLAGIVRRRVESVWGGMFVTQLERLGRNGAAAEIMREVWDTFEEQIAQDTSRGWLFMQSFYLQLTKR